MASQQPLRFAPLPKAPVPRRPTPSNASKRSADSSNAQPSTSSNEPTLPPHKRRRCPPLAETSSYWFTGLHPLYNRHILLNEPDKMQITCGQKDCEDFKPKTISRHISGTNNYKSHYRQFHPNIPLSKIEAKKKIIDNAPTEKFFDSKPSDFKPYDEQHRENLMLFIIENNLSFSLVDKPTTKKLISHLNPNLKHVNRRHLTDDLQEKYENGEKILHRMLQLHTQAGGRIALTTDGWSGNNKKDYSAVTAHYEDKDGFHHSIILDIIELEDATHDGKYLCEKLLEVTDRLYITCSIISVTRDNASPNDSMLDDFEKAVEERWQALEEAEQLQFCCKFNRINRDIRCCAHVYNLAVQAALKALKANIHADGRHHYEHIPGLAVGDGEEVNAFFKTRSLAGIFKKRRLPRQELREMCQHLKITFLDIPLDMPTRWSSTDKFLKVVLRMEPAIRAVLANQQWDPSIRLHLTPTDTDWDLLKEMSIFFELFRRPTTQSQAEKYPTLYNVIPNYLHLLRQCNVWQTQNVKPSLKAAAKAAHEKLDEYYKESLLTRPAMVAVICDRRYKLQLLEYLYHAQGGARAPEVKKAKAHFQAVYGQYDRRAAVLRVYQVEQIEAAANAAAEENSDLEVEEEDDQWRTNPLAGYTAHLASVRPPTIGASNSEVERWLREPAVSPDSSPQQLKLYMQSKVLDFPLITQMARDYRAIPATSAPSERVFSAAGNLISKKRCKISSENLRYVLCLRSWGLLTDDEVDEYLDENGQEVGADEVWGGIEEAE